MIFNLINAIITYIIKYLETNKSLGLNRYDIKVQLVSDLDYVVLDLKLTGIRFRLCDIRFRFN